MEMRWYDITGLTQEQITSGELAEDIMVMDQDGILIASRLETPLGALLSNLRCLIYQIKTGRKIRLRKHIGA